jgi:hypothetical protein
MKITNSRIMRQLAGCLVLLVIMQAAEATAQSDRDSPPAQTAQTALSDSSPAAIPGGDGQNPSTNNAAQPASDSNAGGGQQEQSPAAASQNNGAASSSSAQQSSPAKPVGTAAAPALGSTGVAGSRPTGAVIAPAKQRRVRAILISIGVVLGACVAVGAVAALSHSSPSQPR